MKHFALKLDGLTDPTKKGNLGSQSYEQKQTRDDHSFQRLPF